MNRSSRREKGFTLIELMVVVAIIGILAAIGVPRMMRFILVAQTAEAVEQAGRIDKAIRGYASAHPAVSDADLLTAVNTTYPNLAVACATNCLSTLIPQVELAADHTWTYVVNIDLDTARSVFVCIKATKDAKNIYYTNVASAKAEWENNVLRTHYVVGGTENFIAGGSCSADTPAASATSSG